MGSEARSGSEDATDSRESGVAALRRSSALDGPAEPREGHEHDLDHLALLYEDREAQLSVAAAFLEQGLERGERCFYVADDNDVEDVVAALRDRGIDVDAERARGTLAVHSPAETYHRTGAFEREAMVEFWEDALEDATGDDYAGVRAAAEMTWALEDDTSAEALVEYEAVLNDVYEGEEYVVCCQYNTERFAPDVVRDVVRTHPYVIEDGALHDNVYYTPPEDFFTPESTRDEVERMLDTLRERTDAATELETAVQRLQQSNDRLAQFAYAASHDLREPLRMISTYLQLLEREYDDALGETARGYVDVAVDSADRMRRMVEDLLDFARIEHEDTEVQPVDCEVVVDRALDQLDERIAETDAEVAVGDLPTVGGDPDQLEVLFYNLLSNALTYSDDAPSVEVVAERRGDRWAISVTDDGIGIDPADIDRIFEVFRRLHHHEEYPGTGAGLALCEEVVERHGGEIDVDSTPGEGSTFTVSLPEAPQG